MVPKLFEVEELAEGLEEDVAAAAVGDVEVTNVVAPPPPLSVTTDVMTETELPDEPWVAAFFPEALGDMVEVVEGDGDDDEGVLEATAELEA